MEVKECLGKYGEKRECPQCDFYKPDSECYRAKWGKLQDNYDDCGMSSC